MRCRYNLEDESCQLLSPVWFACEGEGNCGHYGLEAEIVCPSCNNKGASWSGWAKHGGFNYTCWNCGHVWVELLTWPETPGVCSRCGKEFDNSVPEVTHPEGIREIACREWCAECNAYTMSVVFRDSSAFRVEKELMHDPRIGGRNDAG